MDGSDRVQLVLALFSQVQSSLVRSDLFRPCQIRGSSIRSDLLQSSYIQLKTGCVTVGSGPIQYSPVCSSLILLVQSGPNGLDLVRFCPGWSSQVKFSLLQMSSGFVQYFPSSWVLVGCVSLGSNRDRSSAILLDALIRFGIA